MGQASKTLISGKKLAKLRVSLSLTQRELGEKLGLGETRISQIERSEVTGVFPGVWRALADLMGQSVADCKKALAPDPDPDPGAGGMAINPASIEIKPAVPTFDLAVAAGEWTEVAQIAELRDGRLIDDGRFRIHIRGDSMTPDWPDGGLIEFHCLRDGRHTLHIGDDYYVQVGELGTFKRLEAIEEDRLTFRACNRKKYPKPLVALREEIVRMAKAEYLMVRPGRGAARDSH